MTAIGEYDVELQGTEDGLFLRFFGTDLDRHKVITYADRMVVIKIPGRHVYAGQGQQWIYRGVEYGVFELNQWPPDWPTDGFRTTARKRLLWSHWEAQQA